MPGDKHPSIFSCQMEATVYILQIFNSHLQKFINYALTKVSLSALELE